MGAFFMGDPVYDQNSSVLTHFSPEGLNLFKYFQFLELKIPQSILKDWERFLIDFLFYKKV